MVFIICWDRDRLEQILERLGDQACEFETEDGLKAHKRINELAPETIVGDLGKRPSHTIATIESIPNIGAQFIFVDGTSNSIKKAKDVHPDACYTTIGSLGSYI